MFMDEINNKIQCQCIDVYISDAVTNDCCYCAFQYAQTRWWQARCTMRSICLALIYLYITNVTLNTQFCTELLCVCIIAREQSVVTRLCVRIYVRTGSNICNEFLVWFNNMFTYTLPVYCTQSDQITVYRSHNDRRHTGGAPFTRGCSIRDEFYEIELEYVKYGLLLTFRMIALNSIEMRNQADGAI